MSVFEAHKLDYKTRLRIRLTLGNSVGIGDGERLLDQVGNHEDWWAVSEEFSNGGTGVGQRLELIHVELSIDVAVADLEVFLPNAVKNIRSLGCNLEEPCRGTAGGILGGKKEGEDGLGDLVISKHAHHGCRLHQILGGQALRLSLTPTLRLDHDQNPSIHDAGDFSSSSHANLGFGGTLGEFRKNHVGRLLSIPGLGVGKNDGEVDKLKSCGDQIIIIGNLLDGLIGDVVTNKGAARDGTHKFTKLGHERNGLAIILLGNVEESLEIGLVHLLLAGEIVRESLAGEEAVETLAEIHVELAVEENPVVLSEELVGDIDDTRLYIHRGVENFASHVASGRNYDEPAKEPMLVSVTNFKANQGVGNQILLVEDRDTAQGTAQPLGIILFKLGVHGLQERSNERCLE